MTRRLSLRGLASVSLSRMPPAPDGLYRKCRVARQPHVRSLRSPPRSNGLRDDEPRSQTRFHVAATRREHMDPGGRPEPSEERREGSSFLRRGSRSTSRPISAAASRSQPSGAESPSPRCCAICCTANFLPITGAPHERTHACRAPVDQEAGREPNPLRPERRSTYHRPPVACRFL